MGLRGVAPSDSSVLAHLFTSYGQFSCFSWFSFSWFSSPIFLSSSDIWGLREGVPLTENFRGTRFPPLTLSVVHNPTPDGADATPSPAWLLQDIHPLYFFSLPQFICFPTLISIYCCHSNCADRCFQWLLFVDDQTICTHIIQMINWITKIYSDMTCNFKQTGRKLQWKYNNRLASFSFIL